MYFDNFKEHAKAKFNTALFWEYDLYYFDYKAQIELVVQRVFERGGSEDFYALFNLYGVDAVKKAVKNIPLFSQRDIEFISCLLGIPYQELTAYKNMIDNPSRWPHTGTTIRI